MIVVITPEHSFIIVVITAKPRISHSLHNAIVFWSETPNHLIHKQKFRTVKIAHVKLAHLKHNRRFPMSYL